MGKGLISGPISGCLLLHHEEVGAATVQVQSGTILTVDVDGVRSRVKGSPLVSLLAGPVDHELLTSAPAATTGASAAAGGAGGAVRLVLDGAYDAAGGALPVPSIRLAVALGALLVARVVGITVARAVASPLVVRAATAAGQGVAASTMMTHQLGHLAGPATGLR